MTVVTISARGSILIPKEVRERYGLKAGDEVRIIDEFDHIAIVPVVKDPVRQLRGMFKGGPSLTKALLEERRRELEREERDLPPPRGQA